MKHKLTIAGLKKEAEIFCVELSKIRHKYLFGITDGKAVGTFIEQKFQQHLRDKYEVTIGSSATDHNDESISGKYYHPGFRFPK